jgi:hypothetical protein
MRERPDGVTARWAMVGRKTSAPSVAVIFASLPHAPGLSHCVPADLRFR